MITGVDDQVMCLWAAKYSRDKGLNVTKILSHYGGFGARKSLVNASVLSTVREIQSDFNVDIQFQRKLNLLTLI